MKSLLQWVAALGLGASLVLPATNTAAADQDEKNVSENTESDEVVVYSARKEHLIKPVFEAFTKKTGIEVKYITDGSAALIQRLKGEGKKTAADLLITVDAGNLWQATQEGILQPVSTKELEQNIPDHLKDPQNRWYGLSVRARTIAYNTENVEPKDLSTYEVLASKTWKDRLCLRTAKKVYNQSLVATMIAEHGAKKTRKVVEGWVENLAAPVFSSDTDVLKAIAAGQCDVGIVNSYYYGRLEKKNPDIDVALFWPNQEGNGVHVNVSGAGVTKHAPHKKAGVRLLSWMSTPKAQSLFADVNMEYPANPEVEPAQSVQSWGEFKANPINVSRAGKLQTRAIMLMDKAGYK